LMLQHLLGQPMGMGNPLPDTVDSAYLGEALAYHTDDSRHTNGIEHTNGDIGQP